MIAADMVERMAMGAHAAARQRYPLIEPWEHLTADRRAYQCGLITNALSMLTGRDVVNLANCIPEVVVLPAEPSPFALAELQEAAIGDSGTVSDAKRRYRALLSVAAQPLRRRGPRELGEPAAQT